MEKIEDKLNTWLAFSQRSDYFFGRERYFDFISEVLAYNTPLDKDWFQNALETREHFLNEDQVHMAVTQFNSLMTATGLLTSSSTDNKPRHS